MTIVRVLAVLALRALPTLLDVEAEPIRELHSPGPSFGLCLSLCLRFRLSFGPTSSSCSLREIIFLSMGICTLALSFDELLDGLRIMAEPTRITPCARALTPGFIPANVPSSRLLCRSALGLRLRLRVALLSTVIPSLKLRELILQLLNTLIRGLRAIADTVGPL